MNTNFYKKTLSWLCVMTLLCFSYGLQAQADCASAVDITASLTGTCNEYVVTETFAGTGSATNACATGATDALWFSFVAPINGVADITNTDDPGVPDTRVSVHTGPCGTNDCVGFDDDGGSGFTSAAMAVPIVAGTTYYIEWDDRWGANAPEAIDIRLIGGSLVTVDAVGDTDAAFTITDTDCPGGALTEIGLPGFVVGDGTGTDASGGTATGLTPGTTYEVCTVCDAGGGTPPALCGYAGLATPETEAAPQLCVEFTTTTPCDDPTALTCAAGAAGEIIAMWTSPANNTSSIVEWGPAGFAPGTGTIIDPATSPLTIPVGACGDYDVYVTGVCDTGPSLQVGPSTCSALADPGSTCDGCTPITLTPDPAACAAGGVYPATFAFTAPALAPCGGASNVCFGTGGTNAAWYCFTPACDMVATVTSVNDPAATDTRLSLYSGSCAALVCDASNDDVGGGPFTSEVASFAFTGGTQYFIEWDDRWSGNGFEWEIIAESEDAACATPLCIPTAGQWGLICLTMSFLILGLVWMREDQSVFVTE